MKTVPSKHYLSPSLRMALAIWISTLLFLPAAWGADVNSFSLFKDQRFLQMFGLPAPMADTSTPYEFLVAVRGSSSNSLESAELKLPGGDVRDLSYDGTNASYSAEFDSAAELDGAYPVGTYRFTLSTTHDGTRTPSLALTAATFPPAPNVKNPEVVMEIAPQSALTLLWDPFTGAGKNDGVQVIVEDLFGNAVFRTPDLGTAGALSATATNVTIPASTWSKVDPSIGMVSLKIRFIKSVTLDSSSYPGATGVAGYCTTTTLMGMLAATPTGPDVRRFAISRGITYGQTNATSAPVRAASGFVFNALATPADSSRVLGVTLAAGNRPAKTLTTDDNGDFYLTESRASQSDLDADFPAGGFTWSFNGANDGSMMVSMSLDTKAVPAPRIVNFDAAQKIDPTNAFVVQWERWTNGTENDVVQLIIEDSSGEEIYRSADWWDSDHLSGSDTSIELPADQFALDQVYHGRLRFQKQVALDTDSYPGATGLVACFAETSFSLSTVVPPPPLAVTLPSGGLEAEVGGEFSFLLDCANGHGPFVWSIASGKLPQGLSLDPVTGEIHGFALSNQTSQVRLRVTDRAGQIAEGMITLTVTGSASALAVLSTNLPAATSGITYVGELAAIGGVPPYQWSLADKSAPLPAGLCLNPDTGLIGGTPSVSGLTTLNLMVVDALGQKATRALPLQVLPATAAPPLSITNINLHTPGAVTVQAQGDTNLTYTLETSSDLTNWTPILSTNTLIQSGVSLPIGEQQTFYRISYGIPQRMVSPVNVAAHLEDPAVCCAVSNWVDSNGRTLSLTNAQGTVFTLSIPANAVTLPEMIRMTAIKTVDGLPGSLVGAVQLEPEGLFLSKPATLTITPTNALALNNACYSWSGSGRDLGLSLYHKTNNSLVCTLFHFSGHGGASATAAQLAPILGSAPCNRAAAAIALIVKQKLSDYLAGKSDNSSVGDFGKDYEPIFREWFETSIQPKLKVAETDDSLLSEAAHEYLTWGRNMELLGGDNALAPELARFFPRQISWAVHSLAVGHLNAINKAHLRAVNEYKPFQAGRIIYFSRSAQLLGIDKYLPGAFDFDVIAERIRRIFRFEIQFESIVDADFPPDAGQYPCADGCTPAAVHVTQHVRSNKILLELADDTLLCWKLGGGALQQEDWSVSVWGGRARIGANPPGRSQGIWFGYLKILTDDDPQKQDSKRDPCEVPGPPAEAHPTGITLFGAVGDAGSVQIYEKYWFYNDAFNFGALWRELYSDSRGPLLTCSGSDSEAIVFHEDWTINPNGGHLFARMTSEKSTPGISHLDCTISATTILDLWHAPLPPEH